MYVSILLYKTFFPTFLRAQTSVSDGPATDDGKAERPQIVFFK